MKTAINAKALRAQLQGYANRIDGLSLRERVIVFLCLAAMVVAALDSFFIEPTNKQAQAHAKAQLKQNQDLLALREQFTLASGASRGSGQDAALQQRLSAALQQQTQLKTAVLAGFQQLGAQTGLRDLLATLLQQHARLSLVKLTTMDEGGGPAPLRTPTSLPTAAPTTAPGQAPPRELQWRGIEMQITGDYLDQVQYLRQLEREMPNLHWGEMRLWSQGNHQPVLLQLQVFVPKGRT